MLEVVSISPSMIMSVITNDSGAPTHLIQTENKLMLVQGAAAITPLLWKLKYETMQYRKILFSSSMNTCDAILEYAEIDSRIHIKSCFKQY